MRVKAPSNEEALLFLNYVHAALKSAMWSLTKGADFDAVVLTLTEITSRTADEIIRREVHTLSLEDQ